MQSTPSAISHFDLAALVKHHPLASYFVLAYGLSWLVAAPLALAAQGAINVPLPLWVHYFTAYGPLLAALLITRVINGPAGLWRLWRRVSQWRIGPGWLMFAAVSPVVLYALIALAVVALGGAAPTISQLGAINFLPNLGFMAWPLWILTYGVGEETGWRGFALPRLQQRYNALVATLILGVMWAGWHIPFFFYLPNYRAMGLVGFPGFALGIILGAIVFTWLYNSTQGSVFAAILWHGAFNFVTGSEAGQGMVAIIMSIVVMAWAILIVTLFKPATLSHAPKQTD